MKSTAVPALDLALERISKQVNVPDSEFNAIWRDLIQEAEVVGKMPVDNARAFLAEGWPAKTISLEDATLYVGVETSLKEATDLYRKEGLTPAVTVLLAKFSGVSSSPDPMLAGIKTLRELLPPELASIRDTFISLACVMASLPVIERSAVWPKDLFLTYNRIDALMKDADRLRHEIYVSSN